MDILISAHTLSCATDQHKGCTKKKDTDLLLNGQHAQEFEPLASNQNGQSFASVSGPEFLKSGNKKEIKNIFVSLSSV